MTATINGFTVLPYGSPLLKTYTVPGTNVDLSVRIEIAPLILGFAADFNQYVEPLIKGQCACHAYRKIAGSDSWSFHAPGIAWDANWDHHPMGTKGTFTSRKILEIRKLQTKWSYAGKSLFRWGGDYKTRPDDMHFELIQSRANCLDAVRLLQTHPRNWTEKLVDTLPVLRKGVDNPAMVKTAQGLLIARGFPPGPHGADGEFGDDTERATKLMQTHYGAEKVDGVWGPETWPIGLVGKDIA